MNLYHCCIKYCTVSIGHLFKSCLITASSNIMIIWKYYWRAGETIKPIKKMWTSAFNVNQIEQRMEYFLGLWRARREKIRSLQMLQLQVTNKLMNIQAEGMINCLGSNYSSHKMLKSKLKIQGEALTKRSRKSIKEGLIYNQQVLFEERNRTLARPKIMPGNIRN